MPSLRQKRAPSAGQNRCRHRWSRCRPADNQMPTPGVQRRLYLFAQPVAAGLTHIRCAGGVSSSPQLCAISIMARSPGRIRNPPAGEAIRRGTALLPHRPLSNGLSARVDSSPSPPSDTGISTSSSVWSTRRNPRATAAQAACALQLPLNESSAITIFIRSPALMRFARRFIGGHEL